MNVLRHIGHRFVVFTIPIHTLGVVHISWTVPKTWAVGSNGTSADLNTYVRDNTSFLYGDTAWNAPTFTNSWGNSGGSVAGYRKVGNQVWLTGTVWGGSSGTAAFQLPAGYRPPQALGFSIAAGSATQPSSVTIDTSGHVFVFSGSGATAAYLDGVKFFVV